MSDWKLPRSAICPKDAEGFRRFDGGLYPEIYEGLHGLTLELLAGVESPRILEIGVRAGYGALAMLSARPDARYLGLDAENGKHGGQGGPWTPWAREILKPYDATILLCDTQRLTEELLNRFIGRFEAEFPNWTGPDFALGFPPWDRFELIRVDGDHSEAGCLHDLRLALEALAPGGAILADDYHYLPGVRRAVNEFARGSRLTMEVRPTPRGDAILRRADEHRAVRGGAAGGDGRAGDGDREGHPAAGPGPQAEVHGDGAPRGGQDEGRRPGEVQGGRPGPRPPTSGGRLAECGGGRPDVHADRVARRLGKGVTLVIASRDEGDEILRTCASALESPGCPVEIVVVDDASVVPVPDMPGVTLRRAESPMGLFAAKRLAVGMASHGAIAVSDAHIRFSPGWAAAMLDAASASPDAVHVALGRNMRPDAANQLRGTYYGANFVVRREAPKPGSKPGAKPEVKILEGVWQSKRRSGAIPCPMGSVYATTKAWWCTVDMLEGLRVWGGQEPDMALRTWLAGGEVLLLPDVHASHMFRKAAPYPSDANAAWQNRMRLAAVLPPLEIGEALLNELAAKHPRAASAFDLESAKAARRRFDEVRKPGSWEAWFERFPDGVIHQSSI